jgi:small Trp-rich protein
MWFVIVGVLLIALKLLDLGPMGGWSWWAVLSPFACATAWWWWADFSGYTKRREMDRMDERRLARRRKSLEALGLDPRAYDKQQRKAMAFRNSRQRQADKIEGKREAKRSGHRESILNSRFDSSHASSGLDNTVQATQQADSKR